jgi:hypothetical protein
MIASDYITLSILDKIFKEKAQMEVKPLTKMLYINVLTHHFKSLEANEKNLSAFDMFPKDLKYERFKNKYQELHKAKLITIGNNVITFNNVWGSYIDRSKLIETAQAQYGFSLSGIDKYKEQLLANQQMIEVVCMKNKLTRITAMKMLDMFILEQDATKIKYDNLYECTKHFINWASTNATRLGNNSSSNKTKLLGL